jgi:hypothetical protein
MASMMLTFGKVQCHVTSYNVQLSTPIVLPTSILLTSVRLV